MQTHGVTGVRSETGGESDVHILRLEHAGDGPVAGEGAGVPHDPGAVPPLELVAALRAHVGPLVLGVEMARQALGQPAQRQLGPSREVAEEAPAIVLALCIFAIVIRLHDAIYETAEKVVNIHREQGASC